MTGITRQLNGRRFSIERVDTVDSIANHFRQAILRAELASGERIRDAEWAAALAVPRLMVREALRRLTVRGLVRTTPSRFYRVKELDEVAPHDALRHLAHQLTVAVRLASIKADDHTRAALAEKLMSVSDTIRDVDAGMTEQLDALLVALESLVASADNPFLLTAFDHAWISMRRNPGAVRLLAPRLACLAGELHAAALAFLAHDHDACYTHIRRVLPDEETRNSVR